MIEADDREAWADLLDALEEPPAPELAARVADTFDVSRARADEAVFEAIDDGPLVEDDEAGGAYGVVRLADSGTVESPEEKLNCRDCGGTVYLSNHSEDTVVEAVNAAAVYKCPDCPAQAQRTHREGEWGDPTWDTLTAEANRESLDKVGVEYEKTDGDSESANPSNSAESNPEDHQTEDETPGCEPEEPPEDDDYHVEIPEDRIADHYDRVRGVYERLASVGDYPTMGLDDLAGWYITRDEHDAQRLADGYDKRRRPASFEKDLDTVLGRVDRTIYGLTTYKSPEAFARWKPARLNDANQYEYADGNNPTPEITDLRAVCAWGDIDLRDELKPQRGDLDDETKATAEATLEAYAEEFGKLVGGTDAVYGLDSVGGAYLFTAPEASVEIAEHVAAEHGEEWAGRVLNELLTRSNEWLKEAQKRVEERVDGASDVIDPDWANNHNRKYKAPLSIHKDHDAVTTPIDTDDVDYSLTRLDAVDGDLVAEGEAWADRFTAEEHTDRVAQLVAELFDAEPDSWREAVDEWVETKQAEAAKRQELRNQQQQRNEDRDLDLSEYEITTRISDVEDAIDDLDITDVADDTIVTHWTENKPELTDRSGSNKKAIVPTWAGDYNSGNATYIDTEKGIFNDTADDDHGTAVEMALIDRDNWSKGEIAEGRDWARGVQYLREMGYNIPVWTPDAEAADAEQMPYWALRSAALALGVVEEDDLVERDSDTGEIVEDDDAEDTYLAFPPGTYAEAIEVVEDAGLKTGREPPAGGHEDGEPEAALPLERLNALDREEARRFASKRGVEWPTTRDARERLRNEIMETMHHGDMKVIDAPTALGKSYTVATEPWLRRSSTTGEAPVVQFSETREARDQAAAHSADASVQAATLLGRTEACPVAAGDHDPVEDDEKAPDTVLTMHGQPASEWFESVCEGKGVPFSVAHQHLDENNDQDADLPCCAGEGECPAIAQWEGLPRTDEGDPAVDVIHATHGFAHVPSLRNGTNMVFDEEPDFREDLSHERIRRAVAAYLKAAEAPVSDFERFVAKARRGEDEQPNEHSKNEYLRDALDYEPEREWYLETDGAHTLAPALTKAIYYALRPEEGGVEADASDANGRYNATVGHEPPRLDKEANDDEGWNRVWVSVVLDADNTVRTVRSTPDTMAARSVIGLDAHPCVEKWQRNAHPDIMPQPVLNPDERRLWRRYERGLTVVGVGDATRPLTSGEYFDEDGTHAFLEALREHHGDRFRTAITANSVEHRTEEILREIGVDEPDTMHYGEEKSRGDFGDEDVGALNGCIDPGDDFVLDLLAEAGLDATPETRENDDGEEYRAKGRGFEGPDAGAAERLLASVRENHVAQAAGRYARNADDADDEAVVYVRTDAAPEGYLDLTVPGVEWLATDRQREIVGELRQRPSATTREIAEATDTTKEHVRQTLDRLHEEELVECREHAGEHGAHLYRAMAGLGEGDLVDLTPDTTNDGVCNSYTWSLAVSRPDTVFTRPTPAGTTGEPASTADTPSKQRGLGADTNDDPPN